MGSESAVGHERNPDEVLRAAVAMLQRRWTSDDAVLRADLAAGLAALDSGDFIDVADEDLDRYLAVVL